MTVVRVVRGKHYRDKFIADARYGKGAEASRQRGHGRTKCPTCARWVGRLDIVKVYDQEGALLRVDCRECQRNVPRTK